MKQHTLCFIVPAHGRLDIAAVCLRQLRRTCDALADRGILASAIVIADDENLELAHDNGFATVERDNLFLGRKINDGYQAAGEAGFDYMVPFGSDDWIDPDWIQLPNQGWTVATHLSAVVSEDHTRLAHLRIPFGDGVRVFHRSTLENSRFRPAEEDRGRAIDTSTHLGVENRARLHWHDTHPLCIVDWKSPGNLNTYADCARHFGTAETEHLWGDLTAFYPAEAIVEMRELHDRVYA